MLRGREQVMSEAVRGGLAENVYDVIVLGAGPVGENVADRVRVAGLTVVVVERELVGGECSYWACVPSRALLWLVIAVADACRVEGAREAVTGSLDTVGVFGRRDRCVSYWDDSGQVEKDVRGIGAELVRGHGRLDGPRRVAVATPEDRLVVFSARHAVAVCRGSRPALPGLPGIAGARPWTNRRAIDSSQVPHRLAIVGGGPVGVEMATAWQGLGVSVILLVREPGWFSVVCHWGRAQDQRHRLGHRRVHSRILAGRRGHLPGGWRRRGLALRGG
jgi:pyruvate/2-oxoglutarate dehydrogenase complex dihydrolipoamide dehydrogenase (E3) component